jgi:hypothetical protein
VFVALVVLVGAGPLLTGALDRAGADDRTTFGVWDHELGQVAFDREVVIGDRVVLEHTHSVTGRVVRETFSVADHGTIALEELWFDAPGPNLPTGPETLGDRTTTFLEEDGAYRVLHDGAPLGTVPLLVGSEDVDHVLVFGDGQRVRLLDVARAHQRAELFAGQAPPGTRTGG